MHPSSRPSVPPRSRKFENRHTEVMPSQVTKKGDEKSFKAASSHHNIRGPAESSRLKGQGARAPIMHSKSVPPQKLDSYATRAVPKPKTRNTALNLIPAAVDPNCNEPSLPCLCCDGHSPQDSNSLFNHNHNNNNTVNIRQQMKLPPPLPLQEPAALKVDDKEEQLLPNPKEEKYEKNGNIDEKEGAGPKIDGCHMKGMVDVNGNDDQNDDFGADDDHVDIDEEDDDDTLVASCCNCPESMLDFSLTSSTSSSSTSISSCSDLECDCPDLFSLSSQEQVTPECYEFSRSSVSLSAFQSSMLPLDLKPFAGFPTSPCSSDEGYPSLPLSPLSDDKESPDERGVKVDLLHFLDSMEELGKVDLFYRIVQLAQWETDDDLLVRDRLDHQQKLQRVNKEVQLSYLVKLQQEQLDFNPEDINGLLEAMDSMKFLYKNNKISDSQDFSDAGVDLTGASDLDQASTPDSLTNSPLDSPLSPPKPPERRASSQPGSYICVKEFPVSNTGSTCFSSNTSVPSLPGLSSSSSFLPPLSQPASYFSINTKQPAVTSPSPPIPPPRRRHKARLEALRLAELERIPQCLPPPASRPPPLPPPPSISSPPPLLPPPPSFHALDVEIRKLLALAGLTQAELLKLSPELGVCVDAVLENEQHATSDVSQVHIYGKQMSEFKGLDSTLREEIFFKDRSTALNQFKGHSEGFSCEQNEANRTTSFTEMARQRKRNGENCSLRCMYGTTNVSLSPISYNTDLSNTNVSNVSFGNFDFNLMISDKPPPPPPRPLPPNPPIVSNHREFPFLKSCSVPANASRPDRFDWLIAFTPDAEPPFLELQKSPTSGVQEASNLGTKVTTFKELRKRSKQSSPPTRIQSDPDPIVITPDPDFLYNLKWRREKTNGDGWEYTSQAQASFLQPPSTPASLSLFREMCHLNTQEDCSAKSQMSQNVGTSVREGSLRTICGGRDKDWHDNQVKNDDREIRGKADGAWTLGSRTSVSSPPLSHASPYSLHSDPLSQSFNIPKQTCRKAMFNYSEDFIDSLYCSGIETNQSLFEKDGMDHNVNIDSLYGQSDSFSDSPYLYKHSYDRNKSTFCPLYQSDFGDMRYEDPDPESIFLSDFDTLNDGDITPYKNIDMQGYVTMCNLKNKRISDKISYKDPNVGFDLNLGNVEDLEPPPNPFLIHNNNEKTADNNQQALSFPAYYLYHPKNCPLHKGSPPRLSPDGAISPPYRSGTDMARLSSPLFPRSHTLPALAAPLYYPYLYTSAFQAPLREPSIPIPHSQQSPAQLTLSPIPSLSCAVAEQRDVTWMEHDVKPMKECLLEKKTLVNSLSASVEAILAEFNSSRTVVQKTLSGDSSINPPLARLVLQCLCPAVHSLLCDGLKPYQSDVIAGRRPNSPWGLIQASTKPGLSTHALHNLQTKVAGLTQLKQSRHKFNAFLFGLLNIKLLDYWIFHLLSCNDVLEAYYRPTSFMRLSLASCQPLFEELLLLLQPLSLLTFNLDLLFQHHHLEPSSLTMTPASKNSENFSRQNEHMSPKGHFYESMPQIGCMLNQDLDGLDLQGSTPNTILGKNTFDLFKESAYRNSISLTSSSSKEEAPLCWLIGNERFEDHGGRNTARLSQQAGQALQQGWGAVVRLGELLGQNLGFANSSSAENVKVSNSTDDFENHREPAQHCQQEGSSLRDTGGAVSWSLGRLFGASRSSSNTPTRRPSQWLSPSVSVLTRIANLGQSVQQEKSKLEGTINSERDGDINETIEQPKPQRVVRTLCDHLGTGAELSFKKGEKLILLGGVDQDWIRCRQGHKEGLVSIDYASLIM